MAFNEARSAKVQAFLSRQGQRFPEIKEMQERYEEENQRGRFLEQQYREHMQDQYERDLMQSQLEKKRIQEQYYSEQVRTYEGNGGADTTTTHIEENRCSLCHRHRSRAVRTTTRHSCLRKV